MERAFSFLDSFGFIVGSLSDIARTLEFNAEGIIRFWYSIMNLTVRVKGWGVSFYRFMINMVKSVALWIYNFVKEKIIFLFKNDES